MGVARESYESRVTVESQSRRTVVTDGLAALRCLLLPPSLTDDGSHKLRQQITFQPPLTTAARFNKSFVVYTLSITIGLVLSALSYYSYCNTVLCFFSLSSMLLFYFFY